MSRFCPALHIRDEELVCWQLKERGMGTFEDGTKAAASHVLSDDEDVLPVAHNSH
jgi:hypothetical protein